MKTTDSMQPGPDETLVFDRTPCLIDKVTHYCPGCHHGIAHRLVAEAIDELGLREKTILAASVGCSAFLYDYMDVDCIEAPHGRASAVA
jgi:2-oxoglutarate ferredoxin oxidoreductase subunit beta